MFETAIKAEARRRIRQISRADIVVGIASYRNAKTIADLVQQVATGLATDYADFRTVLVVADGGSTDETAQLAAEPPMPESVKRIVTGYHGMVGKGSAVRAVFQVAAALEARACIMLDGDLKNFAPRWIRMLAEPILSGQHDYAVPYYTNPRSETGPVDMIAHPLIRMLLGRDVRQPTADVFAVSGELASQFADKDVWETDVARAGIGVWITAMSIRDNVRVCQVAMGTRHHETRDPTSANDQAFSQTMGTLFRMAYILRKIWLGFPAVQPVPIVGDTPLAEPDAGGLTEEYLANKFLQASKRQRRMWQVVLTPQHLDAVKEVLSQPLDSFSFPDDLWARCVCDFIVVYNKGETDPDRIVEALIPLCAARQIAFLRETDGLPVEESECVVTRQADAFIVARPYLRERWEIYVPWASVPGSNQR